MAFSRVAAGIAAIIAALLIPACSDGGDGGGDGSSATASAGSSSGQVPDFLLLDANPGSASYQASVSPRDYLGKAPGFYFTHAS